MAGHGLADFLHTDFHPAYPFSGQPVTAALVEQGNYLPFQKIVKGLAFHIILKIGVLVFFSLTNGPPYFGIIGLVPPAVQN